MSIRNRLQPRRSRTSLQRAGPGVPRRRLPFHCLAVEALEVRSMMTAAPTASFSASDAMLVEGNDGTQYAAVYVSLSAATSKTTQVSYNTADGTANAGSDYLATSGALTFAPGVTTRTVLVPVKGDRLTEANENFVLNLRGAKGAKIADGQGVVTIF